jgi:hypothetical protein
MWARLLGIFSALKDFEFQPVTNWFSPHFTFGVNTGDRPVETKVLDTVGSYGSQINRIMDAMSVLVSRLDSDDLTSEEQFTVSKFKELALLADKAATEFEGKPGHEDVTLTDSMRWLDDIEDLRRSKPAAYARIAREIQSRLGESISIRIHESQ